MNYLNLLREMNSAGYAISLYCDNPGRWGVNAYCTSNKVTIGLERATAEEAIRAAYLSIYPIKCYAV